MKLLLLLINVVCFWLAADPAHAEPISTAIAAISTFIGSIGVIGKLVLSVAINVGISLIEKATAKKSDTSTPSGVKLEISMGDDQPMSFVLGNYATAGRRKYIGTWGDDGKTPNAYLTDVIELGNLPASGLNGLWADDRHCTILWSEPAADGRGYPVSEYRVNGKDYLWIKFVDGTQTVADPFLRAKFGSDADRPFKATMIGYGCPYVAVTARYNTDLFSGLPNWLFEVGSIKLYDLRKDSTNGGSGAHRWNDPSTWEPSLNPVVMAYNVIRGIYYGNEWVYGGQNLAAFCLAASSFIAGANACDIAVSLSGGGTEPSSRAGIEVHCDQAPLDTVNELMKVCNGRMAEVGGIFKPLVGVPGAAVYSFSDDDVVVTQDQDYDPFPSLGDTYNAIEATYPEPSEKWASKDAPGRYYPNLEAADGNRRLPVQVELPAAPYANQVQRVGQAMILDYRRFRTHQFYLPPDAYPLEPNDCVSYSSARNGYSNKKFLVVKSEVQRNFLVLVTLKEIDPSDYDWDPSQQLPTAVGWIGSITPPVQPMYGWQALPATINDASGVPRRPSIEVIAAPDQDDVRSVWIQVRLKATGDVIFDSNSTVYASPYDWVLNGTFLPNTVYQARGKFVPFSTRPTDWSDWLDVTTPNVLLGSDDVYLPGVIDDLKEFVSDATKWIRDGTRQALLDAQRLARTTADQDFGNYVDRQSIRTSISSQVQTAVSQVTAAYTSAITAATGPGSALVNRLDTLDAEIIDVNAGIDANASAINAITTRVTTNEGAITSISQQLVDIEANITDLQTGQTANSSAITVLQASVTSINGTLSAQADSITSLTAQVGDVSASANFRMSVYAAASGYSSRIGMEARAGSTGNYRTASLFIDVPSADTSPTRVAIVADQFSVTNGTNYQNPFIFQSGVAYLNSIKVQWADIVNANIQWANISTAVVNNFVATAANIGSLVVGVSNLDFNVITDTTTQTRTGAGQPGGEIVLGSAWVINNPNPNPVLTSIFMQFTIQAGSGSSYVRMVNDSTGAELARLTINAPSSGSNTQSQTVMIIEPRPGAAGNYQYSFRAMSGTQNVTCTTTQLWWKR
ncbi:phage tail protein [Rhizobium leucaenae]|uniref:phage tail protein n=1 Tax=Rhizobium leucaenae TaxID=29450 RepID=UPI0007EE5878|nr:phage tail protein [Rhizobium leucaenae]